MSGSSYIDMLATQTEKILIDGNNINDYFTINENVNHPNIPNALPRDYYFQYDPNNQQFVYSTGGGDNFSGQFLLMPLVDINSLSFDYYVDEYNYLSIYDTTGTQYLEEIDNTGSIECSLRAGECLIIQLDYDHYLPTDTEVSAYISNITIDIGEKTNATSKLAYIGVPTYVCSDDGETVVLTGSNILDYFTVTCDNCTYEFYYEDFEGYWCLYIQKTNVNAPATFTLCTLYNINNVGFNYLCQDDNGFSGISVKHYRNNDVEVLLNTDASFYGTFSSNNSIFANDTIVFEFDTNDSRAIECYIDSITFTICELIYKGDYAHNISDIYIGVPMEFPIYEEVIQSNSNVIEDEIGNYFVVNENVSHNAIYYYDDFFYWNDSTGRFEGQHTPMGTTALVLQALMNIDKISFDYYINEHNSILIFDSNGFYYNSYESNTNGRVLASLQQGECLFVEIYNEIDDQGDPDAYISNISIETSVKNQVGTEIKEVARKVIAAYLGDKNGVAQQWYELDLFRIILKDFDYTKNNDGTATINGWKGTFDGETSTELIVPDNNNIIL